ncbi:uncharacterized protein LOC114310213 [Camellia sinensis]|uniref:uncharacterized protein LOC114310213 n=1 Tax=Camellia sinensis TaxID=4442 RepID=UPI0010364BD9|nr:uncharacterized protein LOC114310213 [Camellia sinensis]
MKKVWKEAQVSGWASFRILHKLKRLRAHLRWWNLEVFGNIDDQLKKGEVELHEWDLKAESRPLFESEVKKRREVRSQVWNLSRRNERLWLQKSRMSWAQNGDKNTKLFHLMASNRQRKNLLGSVNENGVVVEDPSMVRQVVKNHFRRVFAENWRCRPKFLGPFSSISLADSKDVLESEFSEAEIWATIKACDVNKASGPDGFDLYCIQKCWSIMKGEFIKLFSEFHGEVQTAFLGGRCILNGVLIANEVVDWWKKARKKGIIIKLDYEKAYNSINWEFLLSMMENFGFGAKWVGWIKSCIYSSRVTVLVNGSPTAEFSPQKGLRQGDPLSSFLFNIVAEGLNILLERAKEKGLIKGASIGHKELKVSHLQFADDTIIFCEATWDEIIMIKRILRYFEIISGLKINFHKSIVCGIGVEEGLVKEFATKLNCLSQRLPFTYLGLPLGANPRRSSAWQPVVEKFKKKLASWKMRTIDGIQSNFLWTDSKTRRKIHLVSWKEIILGNGKRIHFWTDRWFNNISLRNEFPRLYSLSTEKEGSLQTFYQRRGQDSEWNLVFRRSLLAWEEKEVQRLNVLLAEAPNLNHVSEDTCLWLANNSGVLSVASVWKRLELVNGPMLSISKFLWRNSAPPKVQFFSWNDCLFNNGSAEFTEMVELLKVRVAFWVKSNCKGVKYSVHDIVANLKQWLVLVMGCMAYKACCCMFWAGLFAVVLA